MSFFKSLSLLFIVSAIVFSSCTKKKEDTASPSGSGTTTVTENKYLNQIYINTRGPVASPPGPDKVFFFQANLYNDTLFIYTAGDNIGLIAYYTNVTNNHLIKSIFPASNTLVNVDTLTKVIVTDINDKVVSVIPVKVRHASFSGSVDYNFPTSSSTRINFSSFGFTNNTVITKDTFDFDIQPVVITNTYNIKSVYKLSKADLAIKSYTVSSPDLLQLISDAGVVVMSQTDADIKTIQITSYDAASHTINGKITIYKYYGITPPTGSGPPTGNGPEGTMNIQGVVNFTNYPIFFK